MDIRQNSMSSAGPLKAIKDKMQHLRMELDEARERCEQAEKMAKYEQEEKQKCEDEIKGYTRRIQLLEDDLDRTQTKCDESISKLEEASKTADESERARRTLENRCKLDEERNEELEHHLKNLESIASAAEQKYEEAARKLAVAESNLERTEDLLEGCQRKIKQLDEEQICLGQQARSFESENAKASQREDSYEETIRDLTQRLKDAENRAAEAERVVNKLQKEVDRLEDMADRPKNVECTSPIRVNYDPKMYKPAGLSPSSAEPANYYAECRLEQTDRENTKLRKELEQSETRCDQMECEYKMLKLEFDNTVLDLDNL